MAEAYMHIKAARQAQKLAKVTIPAQKAYEMGAQGPDPLFCGDFMPKSTAQSMKELGNIMHSEKCGTFLISLIMRAKTPIQRSYALGFLQHYATDIEVHPYVASQEQKGEKFGITGGHGFCEMAMDSFFHQQDTNNSITKTDNTAPLLLAQELVQIGVLLSECTKEVFEKNAPPTDFINSLHCFRIVHSINHSKYGVKKLFARALDKAMKTNAYFESHVTPGKIPKGGFASTWLNPYTKKEENSGPQELLDKSAKRGAYYILQTLKYYKKEISSKELFKEIGSNSYVTGLNWNIKFDENFNRV